MVWRSAPGGSSVAADAAWVREQPRDGDRGRLGAAGLLVLRRRFGAVYSCFALRVVHATQPAPDPCGGNCPDAVILVIRLRVRSQKSRSDERSIRVMGVHRRSFGGAPPSPEGKDEHPGEYGERHDEEARREVEHRGEDQAAPYRREG